MACYSCGRGFYEECINPDEAGNPCGKLSEELSETARVLTEGLAWQKDDSKIEDPKSTGRKRAAVLYPLDRDADCEWLGLKFAGGNKPIIGCATGKQRQRHHGPDKDTLNNTPGNVHRVCDNCHARWHTLNDEGYDWNDTERMPHDPETVATPEEIAQNEIYWATTKTKAPGGGKKVHD